MRLGPTLRFLALAIALAVAPGCLAPPIALPPPEALVETCNGGILTITGTANAGAYVSAFNTRLDVGVIVRADAMGHFTIMIAGLPDDHVEVWQEVGTVRSPFNDLIACPSSPTADH